MNNKKKQNQELRKFKKPRVDNKIQKDKQKCFSPFCFLKRTNEELREELKGVNRKCDSFLSSVVKPVEAVTASREPKCKLCEVHGVTADVKGHKLYCPFRFTDCEATLKVLKKREESKDTIKVQRAKKLAKEREEKKERREINPHERKTPWPLQFGNKPAFDYKVTLQISDVAGLSLLQKQKLLDFLWSKTVNRLHCSPVGSILLPLIKILFETFPEHLVSWNDEQLEQKIESCIDIMISRANLLLGAWCENWLHESEWLRKSMCYWPPNMSCEESRCRVETTTQNEVIWSIDKIIGTQPLYSKNPITSLHPANMSAFFRRDNISASPRLENTSTSPCSDNSNAPMCPESSAMCH